jgi:1-deoxy-D-xylulose-5-phosphate synthase
MWSNATAKGLYVLEMTKSGTNDKTTVTGLLDTVMDPAELRKLDLNDLTRLAEELREVILTAICETGGHLASSLGVVELAIAIHYVFNTPHDRVIWDVGHQTYPHKILTGRRDQFPEIRCPGGLSGFPKRDESPYDSFGTGHASTSISAAMGMAEAFKLAGLPNHAVAVIGDGGLTGGMALEALNQTPSDLANLQSPPTRAPTYCAAWPDRCPNGCTTSCPASARGGGRAY